ncbi:hypothetical protein FHR90_002803 [Endobacter medicaginis]|uniref:Divergent polysaccharide deacetylase family protein n=2 Tax=Endobacter medicaginis TaxID=1181271 RepID=A0A839UYT7_9PROT|nr:divergent polysaccharide deacetylase family protein [Endobacter medicaginis]MBB3174956.1 hypothetical protein [Endobacter medicaginis]
MAAARRPSWSRPAIALLAFWCVVLALACALAAWAVLHRPAPPRPVAAPATAATAPVVPRTAPATAPTPRPALLPPPSTAANPHHWPQVALVLSGIGLARAPSEEAIGSLPAAITLAFSPDAPDLQPLADEAAARGHERLLSLPMEPEGAPRNTEGAHELSLGRSPAANAADLAWALGRFTGYDGLTDAESGQYGEHFATTAGFAPVVAELDRRHLAYISATTPLVAPARTLHADLRLDEADDPAGIDAWLAHLEAMAETHGCALGMVGPPTPLLLDRLRQWSSALPARGVLLLPASAMLPDGGAPCPAPGAAPPVAEPVAPTPPTEASPHD